MKEYRLCKWRNWITCIWIVITSRLEITNQSTSTCMTTLWTVCVRFCIVLVYSTHQLPVNIILKSFNEIVPIGRKQVLQLISIPSVIFVLHDCCVVEIRGSQIHNDCTMIEYPVGTRRIVTVHCIDTIARIQEWFGCQRWCYVGLHFQRIKGKNLDRQVLLVMLMHLPSTQVVVDRSHRRTCWIHLYACDHRIDRRSYFRIYSTYKRKWQRMLSKFSPIDDPIKIPTECCKTRTWWMMGDNVNFFFIVFSIL